MLADSTPSSPSTASTPRNLPVVPRPYTAKLSEVRALNDTYTVFQFELQEPNRLEFAAGQYILLNVPGSPLKKSYSIASPPSVDHGIQLLVDMRPQGEGTRYLGSLTPGDIIQFLAPVGTFSVAPQGESELVFIATGSGIAPFKSMIEDRLIDANDERPITLYWGLRYETDIFWYDDFGQLAQQHKNFTFAPCMSRPQSPEWPFSTGRVTDVLLAHEYRAGAGYYLCGGNQMIQDVKTQLLNASVLPEFIHHEKFY